MKLYQGALLKGFLAVAVTSLFALSGCGGQNQDATVPGTTLERQATKPGPNAPAAAPELLFAYSTTNSTFTVLYKTVRLNVSLTLPKVSATQRYALVTLSNPTMTYTASGGGGIGYYQITNKPTTQFFGIADCSTTKYQEFCYPVLQVLIPLQATTQTIYPAFTLKDGALETSNYLSFSAVIFGKCSGSCGERR